MRLTSPRADHLEYIRDLVILIARGEILSLKEFNHFLEKKLGWKRTRRYHYRAALDDFGLVKFGALSCKLSGRAQNLVNINNYQDFKPRGLNEQEKKIFAEIMIDYGHSAFFLSLFMPSGELPETIAQFQEYSRWISIISTKEGVTFYRGQESIQISANQTRAYRWTIKNWLKAVGLIDEIALEPTKFINAKDTHVLFPIKSSLDPKSYKIFEAWVEGVMQPKDRITRMPLPVLMHKTCTQHYISVKDFQKGVENLYRRDSNRFRLEKISSVYINETYDRIKNYANYPKVDGIYRGTLAIIRIEDQV